MMLVRRKEIIMQEKKSIASYIKTNKNIIYVCLFIYFLMIHIPLEYVSDDYIHYTAEVWKLSFSEIFKFHYADFNGRICTDVLGKLMFKIPFIVWKVLDSLIWVIIARIMAYLFTEEDWESHLVVCSLIVLFPYNYMRSAGYIMTTANYIYTILALLLVFIPIRKIMKGYSVSFLWVPIIGMAIFYAVNHDQTAVALIVILAGCMIANRLFEKNNRMLDKVLVCDLLFAIGSYVWMFTIPGHIARMNSTVELEAWLPEYANWSFIYKIYKGFTTTSANFLFSDNRILFIFCIILAILAIVRYPKMGKKSFMGIVPLLIVLGIRIVGHDKFVIYPERGCGMKDFGEIRDSLVNVIAIVISLFFVLTVFWAIFQLVNTVKKKCMISLVIAVGIMTREMMGLSATIYASSFRTFSVFLFAMNIATLLLLKEVRERNNHAYYSGIVAVGVCALMSLGGY